MKGGAYGGVAPRRSQSKGTFDHIDTWVFDLDNTLYPPRCQLFDQVDHRMGTFIADLLDVDRQQARLVQKRYFRDYGTTLRGLMTCHGIDPHDFLSFVHDIDLKVLDKNPQLLAALQKLDGRKVIFTNGTHAHAERVLDRVGIAGEFDAIFDIIAADFIPKPQVDAYNLFLDKTGVEPGRAAMFEDIARNLEHPHAIGMTTVLVSPPEDEDTSSIHDWVGRGEDAPYVHHIADDLADFLHTIANIAATS